MENRETITETDKPLEIQEAQKPQGLAWAESELANFRLPRARDKDGLITFQLGSEAGMANLCARLPMAEFLADIKAVYAGSGVSDEVISKAFQDGIRTIGKYEEKGVAPGSPDEIRRVSRALVRMAGQGGFESRHHIDLDNEPLFVMIRQAIDFNMQSREHDKAPLDMEQYGKTAMPMLKSLNHAYAAAPFNSKAYSQDPNRIAEFLESKRAFTYDRQLRNRIDYLRGFVNDIKRMAENPSSTLSSTKNPILNERIQKIGERFAKLQEDLGAENVNKVTFLAPGIMDTEHNQQWSWQDDQVIPATLEMMEDQIAFMERTADGIRSRSEADILENTQKRAENERRKNFEQLLPDLEEIKRLEHEVNEDKRQIEKLNALSQGELAAFQTSCKSVYDDGQKNMKGVTKPFAFNREQKYLAAMEKVVQEIRKELKKLEEEEARVTRLAKEAEKKATYQKQSMRLSDTSIEENDRFHAQRQEVQAKRMRLAKELQELEGSVRQAREQISGEQSGSMDKVRGLVLLFDNYQKNPTGDAAEHFRQHL